jgi:hypothetical protein
MNTIEEQEKILNFQKRLRAALEHDKAIDTNDPYIMRLLDRLLCTETNVKPLTVYIK